MARITSNLSLPDLDGILPRLVDNGLPGGGMFLFAELNDDARTHQLIALLVWHGYLPMATSSGMADLLLGKIHFERCVLAPSEIHVGRKVRKRALGFELRINTSFDLTVRSIQRFTYTSRPGDCWLSNALSRAYQAVAESDSKFRRGGVAFHSIELWDVKTQELAAGEIGYTCGSCYSSCTGFCNKDKFPGSGTIQLAVLGKWLERCGIDVWDLGQEMAYKRELGGKILQRAEWATKIRSLRTREVALASPTGAEGDAAALLAGAPEGGPSPEKSLEERPRVGDAVKVSSSGRVGRLLVDDQRGELPFKVAFDDGKAPETDWFKDVVRAA